MSPGTTLETRRRHLPIGFVVGLLFGVSVAGARSYTSFDVPGSTATAAFGINAQKDIVGRWDDADGNTHGFLLRLGGDIVGDYFDADGNDHGYLRTPSRGHEHEE